MSSPNLQKTMVAKLSQRWLNSWAISVDKRFTAHLKIFDLQEKKTYGYKERNEEKRAQFSKVIATKRHENLVYIDESGIDNTEHTDIAEKERGFIH